MKLTRIALFLIAAVLKSQAASAPAPFISQGCGFRVELPAQWKVRSSRATKCGFKVIIPNRADIDIDFSVRDGTLDNQIGFAKENGAWILHGEGSRRGCTN